MRRMPCFGILLWSTFLTGSAAASVVQLTPAKDNTLIQQTNPAAQLSNGAGDMFVGRTNQDGQNPPTISIRRGLIMFDLSSIPAGSTITQASLTVREVMGLNGNTPVELHRVLQDWGQGTSSFSGATGAPATNNDATWLYSFYNATTPSASPTWATPGGSFSSDVSATVIFSVDHGAGQYFTWSSDTNPQMLIDIEDWVNHPLTNFGWLLKGDEAHGQTAKRLNSSESAYVPMLQITYTPVPEASTLILTACGSLVILLARRARRPRRDL